MYENYTIRNHQKYYETGDTEKVISQRKDKLYFYKQMLEGLIHEVTATLSKHEACQFY